MRFFEENVGTVTWEAYGDFQPSQVHKQVAISFRTPRYRTIDVADPVKVFIQLKRPSDGATSEALPFEYLPLDSGRPAFWSLRRALHKKADYNIFSNILSADTRNLAGKPVEKLNGFQEKAPEKAPEKVLETNLDDGVQIVAEWRRDSPPKEVVPEEKSFNDLLNQVAELDEIYSDTQARLFMLGQDDSGKSVRNEQPMDVNYNDSDTYSSLQLAFKNPVEMQCDVISAQGPIIDVAPLKRDNDGEKLPPPYPPKRIRKAGSVLGSDMHLADTEEKPPALPVKRSVSFNSVRPRSELIAPVKKLPPTPSSTLPNPKKQGFLSKLFSKRPKKSKHDPDSLSRSSLDVISTINTTPDVIHIPLHPPESDGDVNDNDQVVNLDLTDAEHYALYMAMAPHATQSEFDEMSCYYSTVEGGKILSTKGTSLQ